MIRIKAIEKVETIGWFGEFYKDMLKKTSKQEDISKTQSIQPRTNTTK